MNPITLLLLAFAMSTDAFAAAIGRGATLKSPRLPEAFICLFSNRISILEQKIVTKLILHAT